MPRVFILEQPKANIDISHAGTFGPITYVFGPKDRRSSVFNVGDYIGDVISSLKRNKFDPNEDFFCLAGSTNPLSLALAGMLEEYSNLKLLIFNASEGRYVEKIL